MVLDPEYGKLKLCRRYFGNGLGPANCTHDAVAVAVAVAQLGKGLLVLQELFFVKALATRSVKPKTSLYQAIKFALVSTARMVVAGAGLGQKVTALILDCWALRGCCGSNRVVVAVVVSSLSGAELYGSD